MEINGPREFDVMHDYSVSPVDALTDDIRCAATLEDWTNDIRNSGSSVPRRDTLPRHLTVTPATLTWIANPLPTGTSRKTWTLVSIFHL